MIRVTVGIGDIKAFNEIYGLWKRKQGGKGKLIIERNVGDTCECCDRVLGASWSLIKGVIESITNEPQEGSVEIEDVEEVIGRVYEWYYLDTLWKYRATGTKSQESYVELIKGIERDIKRSKVNSFTVREIITYGLNKQIEEGTYKNKRDIAGVKERMEDIEGKDVLVGMDKKRFIERLEVLRGTKERELKDYYRQQEKHKWMGIDK